MQKEPVIITGYVNPDLDAYACAAGYAELWQKRGRLAVGACYGQPLEEVEFMLELLGIGRSPEPSIENIHSFIVVDTSDTYHLPDGLDPRLVEEVVDHHLYNDPSLFPNAELDIEPVGAAATLIVERFRADNMQPSRAVAALLYGAIISNTLNFQAKVTTERDIKAAKWLWPMAQLPSDFVRSLFRVKSNIAGDKLLELLRLDMSGSETEGKIFAIGQLELVGVPELLQTRCDELKAFMEELHAAHESYVTFLSLSDVDLGKTYFVSPHKPTQQLLKECLGLSFEDGVSEYPQLILRKEYVGIVKSHALHGSAVV